MSDLLKWELANFNALGKDTIVAFTESLTDFRTFIIMQIIIPNELYKDLWEMNNIPKRVQKQGCLTWDPELLAKAMKITSQDVHKYFTDGRRMSFLMEIRIAKVIGGALPPNEGAGYDLLDSEGDKWEVRCITKNGVRFCPSSMIGTGREFEKQGFINKLDEIRGYILSDIERFPYVPYWFIPKEIVKNWWNKGLLGSTTDISRRKALELIQGME